MKLVTIATSIALAASLSNANASGLRHANSSSFRLCQDNNCRGFSKIDESDYYCLYISYGVDADNVPSEKLINNSGLYAYLKFKGKSCEKNEAFYIGGSKFRGDKNIIAASILLTNAIREKGRVDTSDLDKRDAACLVSRKSIFVQSIFYDFEDNPNLVTFFIAGCNDKISIEISSNQNESTYSIKAKYASFAVDES